MSSETSLIGASISDGVSSASGSTSGTKMSSRTGSPSTASKGISHMSETGSYHLLEQLDLYLSRQS
jgi:hypothetical protein